MTDGPITRRRVLAGLAGAGTLGAGAGGYAATTVSDSELVPVGMTTGSVGIDVDCDAPDCRVEDGSVSFGIGDLVPGAAGSREFELSVVDNPVRAWGRTECPDPDDSLGAALEVRLWIAEECGGQGRQLFPSTGGGTWGTFRAFQEAFAGGRRLDDPGDPCLQEGASACLRLDYRLPADATVSPGAESDLAFELYVEQCRHVSESGVQVPFDPVECEPPACPECVELGKLEVEDDRLEAGPYEFDELESPFRGDGREYELDVLGVTNKDDGEETVCAEFRLLRDGEEALRMCAVRVKGGPDDWTYDVEPPSARTPGELCTEATRAGNGGGRRQPAISHVRVFVCADAGGDGGEGT